MKNMDFKKVMAWLGMILRCPVCNQKYDLGQIELLESEHGEEGDTHLLIHSDCNRCKSSVMFNIDINGPEIYSVGMVTDLTSKDSAKFSKYQPINVDDVIGIHRVLKKFRGDFVKALK
jgi:hypothetical protein